MVYLEVGYGASLHKRWSFGQSNVIPSKLSSFGEQAHGKFVRVISTFNTRDTNPELS